jgi:2-polyprenyl-3-methyl-5-hydroxy-6-metoxy-1,4-benzoquinol methylase
MDPDKIKCLLCGGSAALIHEKYTGYQKPDIFKIYHCNECNTSFSLPEVHTSLIYENIYKNSSKVPGYNRYWRYAEFVHKFKYPFRYLAETSETYWGVRKFLSDPGIKKESLKILEIGSGLGYLTYSLNKENYNAIGLDISQTAVDHAIETFGNHYICADLFDYARLNPGSFDIVILTEVIEHISKPLDFIKSILMLLKSNGKAIITSPNKSLYPPDILWATDLPPVHCWWFSEESMNYIARSLDITVSFVNYKEYYKKNYKVIALKPWRDSRLPDPFFNENGELINEVASTKNSIKPYLQVLLTRIPFASTIFNKLKQYMLKIIGRSRVLLDKDLIVCRERGNIFCAVMVKG